MSDPDSGFGSIAIIILGSKSDLEHGRAITRALEELSVPHELRIASAHRVTRYLLDLLEGYERADRPRVYITVAGRSNSLSGVVDANVVAPVLACPPYGERFAGLDVLSSLRMPGGVAPLVILDPAATALAAAKILALTDPAIDARLRAHRAALREQVIEHDRTVAS